MFDFNLGVLALFSYNLFTAAKGVFLGSFLQKVHPFIVLSLCFSLVTIFFIFTNVIKNKSSNHVPAIPVFRKHWQSVVGLNISAVLGWGGYFYALKLIEPAIVFSLTSGSGPVITALLYLCRGENKCTSMEWFFHAITTGILVILVMVTFSGISAIGHIPSKSVLIGVLAAFICGCANVVNTYLAKKLNNAGLISRQIIPVRFFLLIGVGIGFVCYVPWSTIGQSDIVIPVLLIALVGLAFPIYLIQVGIQKTNPMTVALVLATLPMITLGCQHFDHRLVVSVYSICGAFGLAGIYMMSLIFKMIQKSPKLEGQNRKGQRQLR